MGFLDKVGSMFQRGTGVEIEDDYVELEADIKGSRAKISIRPFTLESFEGIKPILDAIREGYTIALINIAPIKEKDSTALKRAIDKLKKTLEANEGDIAGFGDSWLIATPSFAKVYREGRSKDEEEQPQSTIINEE